MHHVTHEHFIHTVRDLAVKYASTAPFEYYKPAATLSAEQLSRVARAKLLYGRGFAGLRGVTQYGAWINGATDELIEVCAASEENWIQLAGTTIHELAHAAMGMGHGHSKAWKEACAALGLRRVHAAGTVYRLANFAPELRTWLALADKPADGTPAINGVTLTGLPTIKARPCAAGVGVRGGKTRGPGSGSRLRKYVCDCGQIVRASTDELAARHEVCGTSFHLA